MSSPDSGSTPNSGSTVPALRIVRGNPSAEELAALVAVLSAAGVDDSAGGGNRHTPGWVDYAAAVHAPAHSGPGGWRASARRG